MFQSEVEKVEGKDGFERYCCALSIMVLCLIVRRYLGWMQEAHRHYELSVEHVLKKNFFSLFSLMRPSFLRHIFTLHPHVSIVSIFL